MKAMRLPDGQRISNSRLKPKGDISGKSHASFLPSQASAAARSMYKRASRSWIFEAPILCSWYTLKW